jgi:hypothetical protein
MSECNADVGGCTAGVDEDGEPGQCPRCVAEELAAHAEYRREWESSSPAERDPERYAREMLDAGFLDDSVAHYKRLAY